MGEEIRTKPCPECGAPVCAGQKLCDGCADHQTMAAIAAGERPNRYAKQIHGVTVDVYDLLAAYGVTSPPRQHAIKKLLLAGQRGSKSEERDVREALLSLQRDLEMLAPDEVTP